MYEKDTKQYQNSAMETTILILFLQCVSNKGLWTTWDSKEAPGDLRDFWEMSLVLRLFIIYNIWQKAKLNIICWKINNFYWNCGYTLLKSLNLSIIQQKGGTWTYFFMKAKGSSKQKSLVNTASECTLLKSWPNIPVCHPPQENNVL